MPRRHRDRTPGSIQHSNASGNNHEAIFTNDFERRRFLRLLFAACRRYGVTLYAYCLMTTHYHLLAKYVMGNAGDFMRDLNGRYARWFNRRHGRTGHLFGDRYFPVPVRDTDQLHEAGRYVHMNPVDGGIVADPKDYEWSSYRRHLTLTSDDVLDVSVLTGPFSVGGVFDAGAFEAFTTQRRRAADAVLDDRPVPPPPGWLDSVARHFGLLAFDLLHPTKSPAAVRARSVAMLLLHEERRYTLRQLASYFSVTLPQSISRSLRAARDAFSSDPALSEAARSWRELLTRGVRHHC